MTARSKAADKRDERARGAGGAESPGVAAQLREEVVAREDLQAARRPVRSTPGRVGGDEMTGEGLPASLRLPWPQIREQLLTGQYEPQPLKRVEIPKPEGGVRKRGMPTVVEPLIQQAGLAGLPPPWDPTFSASRYGLRPGRSAHQAVAKAQQYLRQGKHWVVDMDLAKFFDRVNPDKRMGGVEKRSKDKRVLALSWRYWRAGVLAEGVVSAIDAGTPQGGPLSPRLSNLLLDQFERELEKRGHRVVRYADGTPVQA
jgi:RNA-directed DNA polymerase